MEQQECEECNGCGNSSPGVECEACCGYGYIAVGKSDEQIYSEENR